MVRVADNTFVLLVECSNIQSSIEALGVVVEGRGALVTVALEQKGS